jgi:hypothetical protein
MNQPTPAFTLSAVATTAACALLAVMVLALTPLPASAAHTAQTGSAVPANPPANVVASPNYDGCSASGVCGEVQPCYTANFAPAFTSAACEREELEAIDHARAKEGVGPMYLPSDFNSLSGDEQLLVVIDLERVDRGLAPLAGIVASLDGVAQQGTQVQGQPGGTFEDPAFAAGFSVGPGTAIAYRCQASGSGSYSCNGSGNPGASVAAGGQISALDADYGWMYDDGYGGSNLDCETPAYPTSTQFVSSSWGSSPSIVSRRPALPVMGAGSLQPNGAGPQGTWTAIFASVSGKTPALVYSWNEALADGADRGNGQAHMARISRTRG